MITGADLYIDGFPHGTPEGYAGGCRGGSCPTGIEFGLSCKTAHTKSNGDYSYNRYRATNPDATTAETAEHLGLYTPPAAPKPPAPRQDRDPEPEEPTMPTITPEASVLPPAPAPAVGAATVEIIATAATIRAWARDNDVDCPAMGKIPQRVRDAYDTATRNIPQLAAPEPAIDEVAIDEVESPAPRPEWAAVTHDADVAAAQAATAAIQAQLNAANETLEAARAHATRLASEMMRLEDEIARIETDANAEAAQQRIINTLHTRADVQRAAILRLNREINALREANTMLHDKRPALDLTPPPPPHYEQALVFALTKWAEVSTQLNDAYAALAAQRHTAVLELETAKPRSWWSWCG